MATWVQTVNTPDAGVHRTPRGPEIVSLTVGPVQFLQFQFTVISSVQVGTSTPVSDYSKR